MDHVVVLREVVGICVMQRAVSAGTAHGKVIAADTDGTMLGARQETVRKMQRYGCIVAFVMGNLNVPAIRHAVMSGADGRQ